MSATTKTTTKTTTKNTICQHCGKEFARIWQHRCKQIKTETNVTLSIEENKNEN